MINVEQRQTEGWVLTEEGSEIVEKGSHEFLVFKAVPAEGLPQTEIKVHEKESTAMFCSFCFLFTSYYHYICFQHLYFLCKITEAGLSRTHPTGVPLGY